MDNDSLVEALALGYIALVDQGRNEEAERLLALRNIVLEGTPTVWSNKKAFRRWQGQTNYNKENHKKYRVIMIEETE